MVDRFATHPKQETQRSGRPRISAGATAARGPLRTGNLSRHAGWVPSTGRAVAS